MSKALSYLIKARPDAMSAYFSFLKDAGKHLDPKTRSLISVITKIDSQTERGLRQYLPRAIRDGASPHEILDAILMAFPTLGLAKIVWAVDIILDMDIPEFRVESLDAEPRWHDLIDWSEVRMKRSPTWMIVMVETFLSTVQVKPAKSMTAVAPTR